MTTESHPPDSSIEASCMLPLDPDSAGATNENMEWKSKKKASKSRAGTGGDHDEVEHFLSLSTASTLESAMSSASLLSALPENPLQITPTTCDSGRSRTTKKKKKKNISKSKSKLKDPQGNDTIPGRKTAYTPSIDDRTDVVSSYQQEASEKSIHPLVAAKSSQYSSLSPLAAKSQAPSSRQSESGRRSHFGEVDTVGMIQNLKSNDDNATGFREVPSMGVNLSLEIADELLKEPPAWQDLSEHSPSRSHNVIPDSIREGKSGLDSFFCQKESADIENVKRVASVADFSARTRSSGESTALARNGRQHKIAMQQKLEEMMRASSVSTARPHLSPTTAVGKPEIAASEGFPNDVVSKDSGRPTPDEMLVRYLRSMGSSYRTSIDIAARFRNHQSTTCSSPSNDLKQSMTTALTSIKPSIVAPSSATQVRGGSVITKISTLSSPGECETVARAGAVARGRSQEHEQRPTARPYQHAFFWERSMTPGAVQMEGRAFGAPVRPVVLERYSEEDNVVVDTAMAFEVTAIDEDEHRPVAYADSAPLSWKDLLMEKSLRRRFLILCFVIITIIVISVTLAVLNRPKYDEALISLTSSPSSVPSFTPTFIAEDILSYASKLSGPEPVSTPGTPQHSAVGWLSTFDTFSEGFSDLFYQRYAMVTLFFSLGGDTWLEQDGWLEPDMHECDWSSAITCTVDGTGRRLVSGLDLTKNGLVGSLPPEIGLTTQLGFLRLSKNQIRGTVPSELFTLPLLGELDLHMNELLGSLPKNLGTEKDLAYLDVSYNRLTGMIPEGFVDLNLIRFADFTENQFSGPIPANLQKLKVISMLSLSSNLFTGTIPEFTVGDLPGFETIDLGDNLLIGTLPNWALALLTRTDFLFNSNFLSGSIPEAAKNPFLIDLVLADPDIVAKSQLRRIDLSYNELTGTIPAWGLYLPSVEIIDFSHNVFNGTLPFSISDADWVSLQNANFASNRLSGTFPKKIPNAIRVLDVSANLLEGSVPQNLSMTSNLELLIIDDNPLLSGNLTTLLSSVVNLKTLSARNTSLAGRLEGSGMSALSYMEVLDLASNAISGTIPREIGDMTMLNKIVLESNQLSGFIPSEIGTIPNLLVLRLNDNLLSGTLPQTLARLQVLEGLGLSGNTKLQGNVPEELCSIETLNLTREEIGCNLGCSCCFDPASLCYSDRGRGSKFVTRSLQPGS